MITIGTTKSGVNSIDDERAYYRYTLSGSLRRIGELKCIDNQHHLGHAIHTKGAADSDGVDSLPLWCLRAE
ncbi:hypothetical protein E3N88_34831 [Mikania micrantha]|uniref:Uncharacterized protein n=1 Tax=Mikania micrantha TaxID=192012 RepID=A0A5N6LZH5_9ASTR|nr:hypothetical protein E3N88_34831 [Mikania micrantha]